MNMNNQVVEHCLTCQQIKVEHQRPFRLLKPFLVLEWKWKYIYVYGFSCWFPIIQRSYNAIWVIIDRPIKSTHLWPLQKTYSLDSSTLHGVPRSIVCALIKDLPYTFENAFIKL